MKAIFIHFSIVMTFILVGCVPKSSDLSKRNVSMGPGSSKAISVNPNSLEVTWESSPSASSYILQYGLSPGSYSNTVSTKAISPATISGLNAGTTYYILISAVNSSGVIIKSAAVSLSATTKSSAPTNVAPVESPLPGSFAISSISSPNSSSLQVNWAASSNATSYTLKYGTASGVYGTTVSTNAVSPATISGLTVGTTYYVMVVANNSTGSKNANAQMSGTTKTIESISPDANSTNIDSIISSAYKSIFKDSFESLNFSKTNSLGFAWGGPGGTEISSTVGVNDKASLAFNYFGPYINSTAEQRFNIGEPIKDIVIRFWLKVPSNFKHVVPAPELHHASNSKLFALWMDDYSAHGDGPSVIWEFWDNGKNGSDLAVHYSVGGYTGAGPHMAFHPFIKYPDDQNKWMEIVMKVRAATSKTSNDGVIQLYRRWKGESAFELFHDIKDANIAPPAKGPIGWSAGYLMGWSNPGYDEAKTVWHVDDFEIYKLK